MRFAARTLQARRPVALVRHGHEAWTGSAARRLSSALLLAAGALLFSWSAATIDLGYTVRPSQVLAPLACGVGLPFVWRGWARLPAAARWAAAGVVLAYLVATAVGEHKVLPGDPRAGEYRYLVYLFDVIVGLAVVGLIAGLWPSAAALRPVLAALVVGAALASVYGIYQWFAQHFEWPFEHVLNVPDSDGRTIDGHQGHGLLGWERVRGTFLEPRLFAAYLAAMLPLGAGFAVVARGPRRPLAFAATLAMAVALVLTSSASTWAILALSGLVAAAMFSVARGISALAAPLGGLLVAMALMGPLLVAFPQTLARVTGRSEAELASTAGDRTSSWKRALDVWASRPVAGHGPGQTSVLLADETRAGWRSLPRADAEQLPNRPASGQRVLGAAYGLWAASLIDTGLLGFYAWLVFLAVAVATGVRDLLRRPTLLRLAIFLAAATALLEAVIASDRLDLRAWILLGALLAAACGGHPEADRPEGGEESHARPA